MADDLCDRGGGRAGDGSSRALHRRGVAALDRRLAWRTGESEQVRAAIAWSSVPLIWALLLWIPELVLFGQDLFTSSTPRLDANPLLAVALIGFGLVELTIGIWAIVVFLKCLGQVQGFSAWRALGNALLAFLIFSRPLSFRPC